MTVARVAGTIAHRLTRKRDLRHAYCKLQVATGVVCGADGPGIRRETSQAGDTAAAAVVAAPAAPERVTSVEGITEYRLANGLRVLLFPDQTKQTLTVNMTYLVGSRHENYGETGMAHLLEHMVFKGSPSHKDIPTELASHGARPNGTTSWDRTNYFETFNATEENLRWALDLEVRSHGQFLHRQEGSRQRDDRGAQRVRARREPAQQRAVQAAAVRRLRLAQLRQHSQSARAPTSKACRSSACRPSIGPTTSRTTPCCWWPARSMKPKTLALVQQYLRRHPAPHARAAARCTRSSRRRTASGRSACAASATCNGCRRAITCRPDAHADFAALQILGRDHSRDAPAGRLHKDLVENRQGGGRLSGQRCSSPSRACSASVRRCAPTNPWTQRWRRSSPVSRSLGQAHHRCGSGARAHADAQVRSSSASTILGKRRPRAERLGGHGRLAPDVPESRPPARREDGRRAARLG